MSTTDTVTRSRTTTAFDEELIPRYPLIERVNHWLGAVTLHLLFAHGARFLDSLSLLAGRDCGRRADRAILAPMVRVCCSQFPSSGCSCSGAGICKWTTTIAPGRTTSNPTSRMKTTNFRRSDASIGDRNFTFGEWLFSTDPAAALRAVSSGTWKASVEFTYRALCGDPDARKRGADHASACS